MGTTVTQEFKKRYNAKVLNAHYTFEKYIQYEDIQNTLEALDIDRENSGIYYCSSLITFMEVAWKELRLKKLQGY